MIIIDCYSYMYMNNNHVFPLLSYLFDIVFLFKYFFIISQFLILNDLYNYLDGYKSL